MRIPKVPKWITSDYLTQLRERCVLKGFSKETIKSYSYNVSKFLEFISKSGLNLSNESVKSYLLIQNVDGTSEENSNYCHNCGTLNKESAQYCAYCGAKI